MEAYGAILNLVIPIFFFLFFLETIVAWKRGENVIRGLDSISSFSSGITNVVKDVLGLLVPEKPILEIPKSKLPIPPIAQLAVVDKDFREFERLWPDHPGPGYGPRPIRPLGELNEKQGSNQTARNKAADGNC